MIKKNGKTNQPERKQKCFMEINLWRLNHCRNSVMRILCIYGLILQIITVLSAADVGTAPEDINLLKNGSFESGMTDWNYYGGNVPGKYEIIKPGRDGEQCIHLQSGQPDYHGGIHQTVTLKGHRFYKLSAWVKADIL